MRIASHQVSLLCAIFLFAINTYSQEVGIKDETVLSTTLPAVSDHIKEEWLINRHEQVQVALGDTKNLELTNVLFIGDSITQGWLEAGREFWSESFSGKPWHGLNLGVSGDKTQNILHRLLSEKHGGLGNLDSPKIKPEIIVLMIGTNNLWGDRPEEIFAGVTACKNRLRELEPQAQLILCSVLPVSDTKTTQEVVVPLNSSLQELHLPPKVTWLNLYPHFIQDDGSLRKELYTDGVHLTSKGYKVWHDLLMPVIQERFKSSVSK